MNEGEGFGMSSLCIFFGCKYAKIIKSFKYFRVKYPSKFIVDYIQDILDLLLYIA